MAGVSKANGAGNCLLCEVAIAPVGSRTFRQELMRSRLGLAAHQPGSKVGEQDDDRVMGP